LTLFEYLAIAYSLVLSMGAVRAASVLPYTFARESRYWVHTVWVVVNLTACLVIFWNFWSFREIEWTFGQFALVLALPTALFVAIAIVAPDEPAEIQSWRGYYYSVRVKLFGAAIAFGIVILLVSTVVLNMPVLHPFRLAQLGMLAGSLGGVLSDRPNVHAGLAVFALASFAVLALWLFNEPGALSLMR
jgi:hypothetical protein